MWIRADGIEVTVKWGWFRVLWGFYRVVSDGFSTDGEGGASGWLRSGHCSLDDFLESPQGLRAGKSRPAGEADGAQGPAGEGNEDDVELTERTGRKGGNEGGAVACGDEVDERLHGGGLDGTLQGVSAGTDLVAAGGEGLVGKTVAVGQDEQFSG